MLGEPVAPFRKSSRDRRAGSQVRVLKTALTAQPLNQQHPQLSDIPKESTRTKSSQSINEPPPVQRSVVPAALSRSKVTDHRDSIATRDPCTDRHIIRGRHLSTVKGCRLTQSVWSQNTAPTQTQKLKMLLLGSHQEKGPVGTCLVVQ